MDRSRRGQAETVGTLLLVALVVVTVSIAGYYALTPLLRDGQDGDGVAVDLRGTVTADAVTLTHRGGDSLPEADLRVDLRYAGTETSVGLDDGTYLRGAGDRFDAGDRWRLSAPWSDGDAVEVVVVHTPSESVLFRSGRASVTATPTPSPTPESPPDDAPPTISAVSLTGPDAPVSTGDSVTVEATVEDDTGVDTVTADATAFGAGTVSLSEADSGRYTGTFTVGAGGAVADGPQTVTVVARDTATPPNQATATSNAVAVDTAAPSLSVTSPTRETPVYTNLSEPIEVTYDATDAGSGVEQVRFDLVGASASRTTTQSSGTVEFALEDAPDGTYDLRVVAVDASGQTQSVTEPDAVVVDTDAPDVETFAVRDESWLLWAGYTLIWDVRDAHPGETTLSVTSGESVDASWTGHTGTESLREWFQYGEDYAFELVSVDRAGNRVCRVSTDTANGNDPVSSRPCATDGGSDSPPAPAIFRDTNHDGQYDSGDVPVDPAAVADGRYDAGDDQLVVTDRAPAITADSVSLAGRGLVLGVDVTAELGGVTLDAGTGTLDASDQTVDARRYGAAISTRGATVDLGGTTVRADGPVSVVASDDARAADVRIDTTGAYGRQIEIDAGSEADLSDGRLRASGPVTVTAGERLSAAGVDIDTTTGSNMAITLRASTRLDLSTATLTARGPVDVSATAGPISLVDGRIDTSGAYGRTVRVESQRAVEASGVEVTAKAPVTVVSTAGSVTATGATLDTAGAYDARLTVRGTDGVDVTAATLTTQAPIVVTAQQGSLDASTTTFDTNRAYGMSLELRANGDASLDGANLRVRTGDASVDLGVNSATLSVAGASLDDRDDVLVVSPRGVRVVGSPAFGTTST